MMMYSYLRLRTSFSRVQPFPRKMCFDRKGQRIQFVESVVTNLFIGFSTLPETDILHKTGPRTKFVENAVLVPVLLAIAST